MRAYGKKKTTTKIEGHQNCGICHPPQKNKTTRGRREGKVVMRRGRTVSMNTAVYRLTPGGEEVEIEVEVSGFMNPYYPGNYENPPEGGDVEDLTATFYDEEAKKSRDIPLTEEEYKSFYEDLAQQDVDDYEPEYEPDYD